MFCKYGGKPGRESLTEIKINLTLGGGGAIWKSWGSRASKVRRGEGKRFII